MQVKVEATIADGHQIDAPRRFRLAIHADANGKRLAPTLSDVRRALSADQHIGIDVVKLNHCAKSQATHGNERPGYLRRNCEARSITSNQLHRKTAYSGHRERSFRASWSPIPGKLITHRSEATTAVSVVRLLRRVV